LSLGPYLPSRYWIHTNSYWRHSTQTSVAR
jgi:hypothetical protein